MPGHRVAFASTALLVLAVVACGGSPSAAPPTTSPSTGQTATPASPTEVPGSRTPAPSPGTFETPWGEAWDALPPGFPVFPESTPADPGDPTVGPVSGAYVTTVAPDDAAALQTVGLYATGYSTEAVTGPYEDGSIVIDAVGLDPACRVQITLRPAGGLTMITVLYGAACPWD
jgi:hypothetical protein